MTETVRGGRYLDGKGNLVNAAGEPIKGRAKPAEKSTSKPAATQTVDSDLPQDFPGRSLLIEAGHTTAAAVAELDKDALVAINGIGPATADQIIAARG